MADVYVSFIFQKIYFAYLLYSHSISSEVQPQNPHSALAEDIKSLAEGGPPSTISQPLGGCLSSPRCITWAPLPFSLCLASGDQWAEKEKERDWCTYPPLTLSCWAALEGGPP